MKCKGQQYKEMVVLYKQLRVMCTSSQVILVVAEFTQDDLLAFLRASCSVSTSYLMSSTSF